MARTDRRRRVRAVLAGALGFAGAALGVEVAPVAAAGCAPIAGLDLWTWDGEAASDAYELAANWDHAGNSNVGVPGERLDPGDRDDQVCIPAGSTVLVDDGISVHVQVLQNAGSMTITDGGKLEIEGDPATLTSTSHRMALKGLLYGRGRLVVPAQGVLTWSHTLPDGASTMSTREVWNTNVALSGTPGRTTIAAGGTLVISGGAGMNLVDRRIIENAGTTRMTGATTYVAADWGTTFRNTGTFDFVGDGDLVEGAVRAHASLGRTRFVNTGQLRKTAGSGTSVVDAVYSNGGGAGTVRVSRGTLSIRSNSTAAQVDPAAAAVTFGTGGCPPLAACTNPTPSSAEPQFSTVRLPAGTAASKVTITEAAAQAGTIGRPVDLTVPTETATAGNPMVLRLAVDATVVPAGRNHTNIAVQHNGVNVPNCTGGAQAQCVDRPASSTTGGDVVMVVRTAANGRWRMR